MCTNAENIIPPKNRNTRLAGAGFLKGTKTCTLTRTPGVPSHIPWGYRRPLVNTSGTAGDVFLLRQDSARDGKRAENRGLSWEENLKMGNESMGAPASCMSRWIGGEGLRKPGFHGSAP